MIAVVIRARTKVIKGGEDIKERGSEKRWREEQKEEKSTTERERVKITLRECESYLL